MIFVILLIYIEIPQTEYKRIVSPLKYQTRCVAAFPDQQGFLVCVQLSLIYKYTNKSFFVSLFTLFNLITAMIWGNFDTCLGLHINVLKILYYSRMLKPMLLV